MRMIGDPELRIINVDWRTTREDRVAEVFQEFESAVVAPDGTTYRACVCGGEARDGTRRWHGWIAFVENSSWRTIRTQRETTQRNRTDTAYCASGLTLHYLEGALRRALSPTGLRRPPGDSSGSARQAATRQQHQDGSARARSGGLFRGTHSKPCRRGGSPGTGGEDADRHSSCPGGLSCAGRDEPLRRGTTRLGRPDPPSQDQTEAAVHREVHRTPATRPPARCRTSIRNPPVRAPGHG